MKIKRGSTSVRRLIFIGDSSSTTGAGLANLVYNSSGLVAYYFAGDLSNEVQITLVTATLGSYTSGGFVAVDNTNMPGWYEIGIPDAALDGGNEVAIQLRGAANMVPVNIYIELDAVDYQSATSFGLSKFADIETDTQDIQSRLPSALINGRMNATVGEFQAGLVPANFAALGIEATGQITSVGAVDELGASALSANGAADAVGPVVWEQLTTTTWPANSFGKQVLIGSSANREVAVTGSNHVAADIHELQPAVIDNTHFAAGAIDANALAADAVSEISTSIANLQVLSRLDSMIESNGAGQFRFDSIAVSLAGGGGGGGDPWTIDLVTGYSGTQAGAILNAVKAKTDLITSGNVQTSLPVTAAGQIASPLVIGDDYLASNGRAFSWTVALPTGYTVGTSSCKFGMRYEDSQGVNEFIATGTVIDAGSGNVTLRFDVPKTTTGELRAGWYDWSVEIANATSEITPVKSGKNAEWQYKQT